MFSNFIGTYPILGKEYSLLTFKLCFLINRKRISEYDQEIPQSQTADNPMAPYGRATQQSRDTRKTNKAKQSALSSPLR